MKTLRYTTREGQEWVVRGAVPMPHAPGFWLGTRHDGQVVIVHEHRFVTMATENAEGTEWNREKH